MIKWSKSYEIGIKMIDEQHQVLLEIAEEAYELLLLPGHVDKYDDIVAVVERLREYTVFHFKCEEELLKEIRYSKLFSHLTEHRDFINKLNQIDLEEADKDQEACVRGLLDFVTQWIVGHIQQKDTQFAKEYLEKV